LSQFRGQLRRVRFKRVRRAIYRSAKIEKDFGAKNRRVEHALPLEVRRQNDPVVIGIFEKHHAQS